MEAANQPNGGNVSETPFYNSNRWSMTFGLEPNYPCCTVNHPQGWPKFLSAMYAKVGKSGIAHTLLAPGDLKTTVDGRQVIIRATTGYPFMDDLHYVITTSNALDFHIRVPSWAGPASSVRIKFGASKRVSPDPVTGLHKISLSKGTWNVSYSLQSSIRTEDRANETVAVYKGALLYAIDIPSTVVSSPPRLYNDTSTFFANVSVPPQSRDWQYFATGKWNIAIDHRVFSTRHRRWTARLSLPILSSHLMATLALSPLRAVRSIGRCTLTVCRDTRLRETPRSVSVNRLR